MELRNTTGSRPSGKRVFLIGATASGKSAVAERVADTIDCRLLSMDSMAVFRHMDIGTAKPAAAERFRYGLIDLVDPCEDFSVGRYVEAAEQSVREAREEGQIPLFVGGTALYFKALTQGLFDGPPSDWALREELRALEAEKGLGYLHSELARVDPESARKLHPNDTKRLVRALEVFRTTGKPISELQIEWEAARDPDVLVFEVARERSDLYARIEHRVDEMLDQGLVEETRRIRDDLGGFGRQSSEALGYREVLEFLNGRRGMAETIDQIKQDTRRFAKRQLTWFRGFSGVTRMEMGARDKESDVAASIAERLEATDD